MFFVKHGDSKPLPKKKKSEEEAVEKVEAEAI